MRSLDEVARENSDPCPPPHMGWHRNVQRRRTLRRWCVSAAAALALIVGTPAAYAGTKVAATLGTIIVNQGHILFYLNGVATNPCPPSNVYELPLTDTAYNQIYAGLLTAKALNLKVQVDVNCASGYNQVDELQIDHP